MQTEGVILPNYDLDGIKWGGGYVHGFIDGKLVRQHRYVMEKHLGRKLLPTEHIHHKNNIPYDNRIDNLQIVTKAEHSAIHNKGNKYVAGKVLNITPADRERKRQDAIDKRKNNPKWDKPALGVKQPKGKDNYLSKPVYQYDISGNLVKEWESLSHTKEGGFIIGNVSRAASGELSHHKGFIWRFKEAGLTNE